MKSRSDRKKVLVVDDNTVMCEVLTEFLSLLDYEAESVTDGESGLMAIENGRFRAVLTDIRMPGMDGIEFTGECRRLFPDLPIIVISGYGYEDEDTGERAMEAGASAVLEKPIRFHQVKAILEKIFPE